MPSLQKRAYILWHMPSVKASLQDEINKLKEQSAIALAEPGVSPSIKILMESMLTVLNVVVALFLEKKVRKTSSNSGLPPSSSFGSTGNRNKEGSEYKRKVLEKTKLKNRSESETSEKITPFKCSGCKYDLQSVEVSGSETRESIDIIYQVQKHSVTCEIKECPQCFAKNKGVFPKGFDGPVQYGIGIKATVINFLCTQMVSLERLQEHLSGIIGRTISQAVFLKYILQFSRSLEGWEADMKAQLLKAAVLYTDETSMRVDKKTYWVHSYSYGNLTLKFIHKSRGCKAMDAIGILPKYGGTIVHDCFSSYFKYEDLKHGLCGAHLLRELNFIQESNNYRWAKRLKRILKWAYKRVNKSTDQILSPTDCERLSLVYDRILESGKSELPKLPEPSGKRGRPKHSQAQNLWFRLEKHKESFLRFTNAPEVDFTNNRAERDLRINKLKQKVSGCFRTLVYAECFCRISSYLKTMRNQGFSSLESIMLALQGEIPPVRDMV